MALSESDRKRILWRAHHRGTKEADMMVGGFADRWLDSLTPEEVDWFERLMEEQDVDIMAWAFKQSEPPADLAGPMFDKLTQIDYVKLVER